MRTMPRVLAAVAVVAVALSGALSGPAGAGAQRQVAARGRGGHGSFNPAVVRIAAGETVKWVATEGDHSVVSDGGSFESGAFAYDYEPHTYSHTFTQPGQYRYHCTLAQMTGVVEVVDPSGGPTTTEPSTTTTTRELYRKPSAAQG